MNDQHDNTQTDREMLNRLRPEHEFGPDCPNFPYGCVICLPGRTVAKPGKQPSGKQPKCISLLEVRTKVQRLLAEANREAGLVVYGKPSDAAVMAKAYRNVLNIISQTE